ncbi:Glutathione reductase [Ophiocordyceps camponoti-floridani]|uniref:Glutathione reductase n=1 Tax=Ophiocordyceps camponoti-floridani TaxID=2030778 RepID=A0A8H4Q3S9_9HYPO|nr:Glutathione reductase [Ophiocordyceps camponoti-floridani]
MAPITKDVDYLVLGGGSGGLASARMASSKYGVKTLIVEARRLGGTCVNVGCVPKKITYNAAAIAESIHDAAAYGFSVKETAPFNWSSFKAKRDAYVKRLNGIYERNLNNDGVSYLDGWGRLLSRNQAEVTLADGSKVLVNAKKMLIAVGGRPNPPPPIPGADLGINSDGFFDIDRLPKRVVIVGAGYIAVEFAGMFNALGTETHLMIRHDTFLRNFDPMVQELVTREYERLGVRLHKRCNASKVEKSGDGKLTVSYRDDAGNENSLSDVDDLIWATGRQPMTRGIGLEEAGVKLNEKGQVLVDEMQKSSVDNIFAIGDVVGHVELTPVAIAAGRKLSHRLFGTDCKGATLDYSNIPSVVFAHPEIGSIGLTEPQAVEKYGKDGIKVYKTTFTAMFYAMMEQEDKGPTAYKLIVTGPDEKVVGLHMLGQGSAEILQGFGVAIKMGATKADFDNCVAIHPTSAEELVTLK